MQKNLLFVIACFVTVSVGAQCLTNVNFSSWQVGGHPANGNWNVKGGGTKVY